MARAGLPGAAQSPELDVFPLTVRPVALRKWRSLWRPFSETRYARGLAEALDAARGERIRRAAPRAAVERVARPGRPRALLNVYQLEVVDWERRRLGSWGERKALLQMRRATTTALARRPGRPRRQPAPAGAGAADQPAGRLHGDPVCARRLAVPAAAGRPTNRSSACSAPCTGFRRAPRPSD